MGFLTGSKNKSPSTYDTRPPPAQPNPAALLQPIWFVDPSDVTGNASDNNTGTTALAPLLTFAEIVKRWGTNEPTLNQATTIIFLSDQPDFSDPVDIAPISNQYNLTIIGTPTVLATGTIGVYNSRLTTGGYATGTLDNFTSPEIADFTPYTDLMVQTTSATFWISPDETTASFPASTAYVSAPMQTIAPGSGAYLSPGDGFSASLVPPPAWVVPTAGETFSIVQPCRVFVTRLQFDVSSTIGHSPSNGIGTEANGIILQNIWVPIQAPAPGVSFVSGELVGENMFFQQCRIDAATPLELGIWRMSKTNCDFTDLATGNTRYYGGIVAFGGPLQTYFGQTYDGDVIVRFGLAELSPAQVILGTVYSGIFSTPAFGTQIIGSPGNGVNGNPGNVYYLSPANGLGGSVFFCPPATGPGPTSPQIWGQSVAVDIFQG